MDRRSFRWDEVYNPVFGVWGLEGRFGDPWKLGEELRELVVYGGECSKVRDRARCVAEVD